jgi:hypothetical protein
LSSSAAYFSLTPYIDSIIHEYKEKLSGKKYPKEVEYALMQGDRKLVYNIKQQEELESRDAASQMPKVLCKLLKRN